MKKKILSFLLAVLMLLSAFPLSILAEETGGGSTPPQDTRPVVTVSPPEEYTYDEGVPSEFRALPNNEGTFYLDITVTPKPTTDEKITVYYRTLDDSAVAEWGDYESVGTFEDAYVILNKTNNYKARVVVYSTVIDHGFNTYDSSTKLQKDKLLTRRFLFELVSVEGNARLHTPAEGERDQSQVYCYLRANTYSFQNYAAGALTANWPSNMHTEYYSKVSAEYEYLLNTDDYFGGDAIAQFWDSANGKWNKGVAGIPYESFYCATSPAAALSAPKIKYKGQYSDTINMSFAEEWYTLASSNVCDLGISINGSIIGEVRDSDGPLTFHLYYTYGGKKKLALSLYLEGEFDDSKFFGFEHAFEYALDGNTAQERKDHLQDNFIGFTLYDNDENVVYEVHKTKSDFSNNQLIEALKKTRVDGYAVELMGMYNTLTDYNDNFKAYYLKLPSDFARADSYSYDLISDSTNEKEVRVFKDVMLSFSLIAKDSPRIAKHENGNLMISTNLDTIKNGDPLRMSVRFDRPVYVNNLKGNFHISADLYNDKGTCLAKGLKLNLQQIDGMTGSGFGRRYYYYAWDTLVFACELPADVQDKTIASLRNIKIEKSDTDLKAFLTNFSFVGASIDNIYVDRDFRTPVAKVSADSTTAWLKAKSLDIYVYDSTGRSRFNDYVTVYYLWSESADMPDPSDFTDKISFHTNKDGEVLKSISGTGNGLMYLHLRSVSSYGMSSRSDKENFIYEEDGPYTPFGPYKFDNEAPTLSVEDDIDIQMTPEGFELTVTTSDDNESKDEIPNNVSGLDYMKLYRVNEEDPSADGTLMHTHSSKATTFTVNLTATKLGIGDNQKQTVSFYWVLADKLGNESGRTAEFSLLFDTNDYILIDDVGPYDSYQPLSESLGVNGYIYDYSTNAQAKVEHGGVYAYYAFFFKTGDADDCSILLSHKGVALHEKGCRCLIEDCKDCSCRTNELTACDCATCDCDSCHTNEYDYTVETLPADDGDQIYVLWINRQLESGRYDIQLFQNGSERISKVYSVYATDQQNDSTPTKNKVESGSLLINNVYQLSATTLFYYKDQAGVTCDVPYNNTKQPATFSSIDKAKEYVLFCEYADIYLYQIPSVTIAEALNTRMPGYLKADGEGTVAAVGQYWIRYKSKTWSPAAGDSAWVYYYYGSSQLSRDYFSTNLLDALNAVANRIVKSGKSVLLTDSSLFLDSALGSTMLDRYGMPYLLEGQVHAADEQLLETKCGQAWKNPIPYAGDKNIYRSYLETGSEEDDTLKQYPIIGRFLLDAGSIYQYMSVADYEKLISGTDLATVRWLELPALEGMALRDVFGGSGIYYVREISIDGVSVYPVCVDREAPEITFHIRNSEDGSLIEVHYNGSTQLNLSAIEMHVGAISTSEYDRLSYVAIYKISDLSLVGVYMASELAEGMKRVDDGKYYVVVSDRSGNHYTVTANISSTPLVCAVKTTENKFIRLTCNRRSDQILRYEVYLNNELVTSEYQTDKTFDKAGLYTIYIQDVYGNEFYKEETFNRVYPTVSWRYFSEENGKYNQYNPKDSAADGFLMTWVSDNQCKISTSVKTRFSFSEAYKFEFVGAAPEHSTSMSAETVVTIEAGQSFTLKVSYKNHSDCYTIYSCVVDVTPPSINVTAESDVLQNGENSLFEKWAEGNIGDVIELKELYYVLTEVGKNTVLSGDLISSDKIQINANDANEMSLLEIYLNEELIETQNPTTGFSQVVVSKWGEYRIIAKDGLGNTSEFTFTNGMPDNMEYFVDGVKKEQDLHGYLNFNERHVYTKVDYGNTTMRLDIKQDADVFMSVGVSGGNTVIYGFSILDGQVYSLNYTVISGQNGKNDIDLAVGRSLIDVKSKDFKPGKEYLISKSGGYALYASISSDKVVSFFVHASQDTSQVVSVGARVGFSGSYTTFVAAELSKKSSNLTFKDLGVQTGNDLRFNGGFTIDESAFDSERIESVRLYYSNLNNLDASELEGWVNIYQSGATYDDDGFYLLIVRNRYGNERIYRIAISSTFAVTSSVTFGDGHKIYYSKDFKGTLYSNGEVTLDVLDENVTVTATRDGAAYTGFVKKKIEGVFYFVFSEAGVYDVKLEDAYGNVITVKLEINKSAYTVAEDLLTGYNEKALGRDEGYTNQKLTIDKAVYDREAIYYLAIQYGDTLKVLFDSFSEKKVTTDTAALTDVIGSMGDGVYTVICRNRYGAVVTKEIHYRSTPTLKLERTTRSHSEAEVYDLAYAISHGFWSNNTLTFITEATNYIFTIDGNVTECPKKIVFESAGEFGSFEYDITYIDEYGFEYTFKAYLVRQNVSVEMPSDMEGIEIDGVLNTKNNVSITFAENVYATYTRNNGEELPYHSGDVLKKDGSYRFTVRDFAGNATTLTIKKDTAVEFAFIESTSGSAIQSGSVVNASSVKLDVLNKDSTYIAMVMHDGVLIEEIDGTKFTEDGKWEIILCDDLGNKAYFCFYIITRQQNGFSYTTPYEYRITDMWYDNGDGVKVSYMSFIAQNESNSSFDFKENGLYTVVMTSDVTGLTSSFAFTVNTNPPEVALVGCNDGETTINDISLTGCKVGDRIKIYQATDTGEKLVKSLEVTSGATKMPTITEGGKYRVVVESEAGVATELTLVRKHVMNTAGSIFVMVVIGLAVVGLFTGLIYRNKSKTDD